MKALEDYKEMKSGFSTPDGYLEGVKPRLKSIPEVRRESGPETQKSSEGFWFLVRPQLSLAASFVAMVVLGYGLFYLIQPMQKPEFNAQEQVISEPSAVTLSVPETNLTNEKIIEYLSETDLDYYYLANNE